MSAECGRGWSNRCITATGPTCVCRCGGVNHGTALPGGNQKPNLTPNGRDANFRVEYSGPEGLVLLDVGPWDKHQTITNNAEGVVARVVSMLEGRRLFYFDSEARLDELKVIDGKFAGFASGAPPNVRDALRPKARKAS